MFYTLKRSVVQKRMDIVLVSYLNSFDLISADTPFGQLKLNEIGAWLGRRNKNPRVLVGAVSRGKIIHNVNPSVECCRIISEISHSGRI